MRRWLAIVSLLACCAALQAARAEPPTVSFLFPAGVERGKSAKVMLDGKFAAWPPKVWTDRAGVTVQPAEQGQLNVTAAADVEPGVYWLRFYDGQGAAKVRPFVVGLLPEAAESEPNNAREKAQKIAAPIIVNGRLDKNDDIDIYAVALKKGQTLIARIVAAADLGSPVDASLQLCTAAGFVLTENDDTIGVDPQIVFTAPQDDTYYLQTFAFSGSRIGYSGAPADVYRLTVTTGGVVDHAFPLAVSRTVPSQVELRGWNLPPNLQPLRMSAKPDADSLMAFDPQCFGAIRLPIVDGPSIVANHDCSAEQPQTIPLPVTITGCIESPRDEDAFRFKGTKGMAIVVQVEARSLGFLLEPSIKLIDAEGKVIREADSLSARADPTFDQVLPADGDYRLVIRDGYRHGGFRYVYRLRIAPAAFDYTMTVAAGEYVFMPGKPLEIPIVITRKAGYDSVIDITALDLPPHITAAAVKSEPKGPTAKDVKLVLTSSGQPWSGPIRIVGRGATPQFERFAQFTASEPTSPPPVSLPNIWLTVPEKPDPAKPAAK